MDLMRTLLIYMSATLTLAVQSTAAPKETPIPSPVQDTAIVETTDTVEKGSETITAAPKAKEKETEKIELMPAMRNWIVGKEYVLVGSELWMPRLKLGEFDQ